MSPTVRPATPEDAAAVCAIYNPYVEETTVSFEEEPVSADEMRRRIVEVSARHDWLLLERGAELLGYAYARSFHARSAYRFTAESTIYLGAGQAGQGLGTQLYRALIERTFARGVRTLVGVIALPNDASVRLHEKLGFVAAGRLRRVGHKAGRWIDVGYWQLERPA